MNRSGRIADHLRGNVVGYIALFVALSGTAAALPGKGSVKADDLAKESVKTKALADGAVTQPQLATGAVIERALGTGAVTATKLLDGAVGTSKLADAAVTSAKLADDSVTRAKVGQGEINGGKLANGAVNSSKVADGTLLAEDFAAGQIGDGFSRAGNGTISLPRAGRVFVVATFVSECGAGCGDNYTVTIDGTPVPGASLSRAALGGTEAITLVGVTSSPLAAGDRSIALEEAPGGTATESQLTFAGILLG